MMSSANPQASPRSRRVAANAGVRRRLLVAALAGCATVLSGCWAFEGQTGPVVNIGGDVTPPTIVAFEPETLSTDVQIGSGILVNFSEGMRSSTLTPSSFTLRTTAGGVLVPGTVRLVGNSATFVPTAPLQLNTGYTASVSAVARDVAGNALVPVSWTFTTEVTPISSLVVQPNPLTIAVGGTQQFAATGRRSGAPTTPAPVTVTWTATGGTISPTGLFTAGTTPGTSYRVTATLAGNSALTAGASVSVVVVPPPAPGTEVWLDVSPSNVDLTNTLSCGNFGASTVQIDPDRQSDLYAHFDCQGIWKSVDFGRTWTGPINTGANGTTVADCAGGIELAKNGTPTPTLHLACIRGAARGYWRSLDGGVSWTNFVITPDSATRQDFSPPVVDPYDAQHLLMAAHERDLIVESVDGGRNWRTVPVNGGMLAGVRSGAISFIDMGNAGATRTTWLWVSELSGGTYGTWRTTTSGTSWTQVDKNEHAVGASETFQLDGTGAIYMAGVFSDLGWGVLRSADYGVTWTQVGERGPQRAVFGTPKRIYSSYSFPSGVGTSAGPSFQTALFPGTGSWSLPGTPAAMRQGAAQVATGFDGTRYFFVSANLNAGLWRYVEP